MFLVKTKIRTSRIHGLGVFAAQFIPSGATVWIFQAEFDFRVSEESIAALPELARNILLHYSAKWRGGYVISADDARFLNHSDSPNLKALDDPDSDIAMRDIHPGEELLEDYREFDETFAGRPIALDISDRGAQPPADTAPISTDYQCHSATCHLIGKHTKICMDSRGITKPPADTREPSEPTVKESLTVQTGKLAEPVRELEIALRNCRMLAQREIRRHEGGDARKPTGITTLAAWKHILRFCEEVGITGSILRGDADTSAAEGTK